MQPFLYSWSGRTFTFKKRKKMKVKTICTHCGKKQISEEIDYSLDDVKCKKCKKEGCLVDLNRLKKQ